MLTQPFNPSAALESPSHQFIAWSIIWDLILFKIKWNWLQIEMEIHNLHFFIYKQFKKPKQQYTYVIVRNHLDPCSE